MSGDEPAWWRRTLPLRIARVTLRAASRLVPRVVPGEGPGRVPENGPGEGRARERWLEEWEGELWAVDRRGGAARTVLRFALGGVTDAVRESIHMRRGEGGTMTGLVHDIRMALRRLRRAPGFSLVTVAVLALGIGANTALFGALRSALLQPPPYPEPDRLVVVDMLMGDPDAPLDTTIWSYPKFQAVRTDMDFLSASAAYMSWTVTLAGAGDPTRTSVELVSPAYFSLLDVGPAVGRVFVPSDEGPDGVRRVVLEHATWTDRFGADPGVVGRTVRLNGESFEVVGVARPGFRGLTGSAAAWVPVESAPLVWEPRRLEREWSHWFRVVGRLAPGVELESASREAAGLGPVLTAGFPPPRGGDEVHGVALTSLVQARVNPTARLAVGVVGAGAVLLLLIAAANAAGLFLARMSARSGDVAVRAALGAGRGRLAREVLTESMLLAVAGGVAGVLLAVAAQGAVRWAVAWALDGSGSRNLQYLDPASLSVDVPLMLVGLGLAVVTGLVAGFAPARAAGRGELVGGLSSAGRGGSGGRGRLPGETARGALVAAQLALTLVLLTGSGLMLASFARLDALDLGFRPEGVLTARFELGSGAAPDEVRAFERGLVERLEALPGVEGAAVATCSPLAGLCDIAGVREVDGRLLEEGRDAPWMHTLRVTPGYFDVTGIQVVRGVRLPAGLTPEDPAVVVISESAAAEHFAGLDPLGRTIGITDGATPEGRPAEIVGVVADAAYRDPEEGPFPTLYFSSEQVRGGWGQILVRTAGRPEALADGVRGSVLSLRPEMPVWDVTTLADRKAAATARTRVILGLLAAFGITALLLSAVGLWGLVSYAVTRRTREMGVRMALGADRGRIVRTVAGAPVLLAASGALVGVGASLLLTRHLGALLFEVDPRSPGVLIGSVAVLLAVAVTAAVVPARRATRIDPSEALRSD